MRQGISIHAPLAGRDVHILGLPLAQGISIHAPLAGRDDSLPTIRAIGRYFNPRAPCGARLERKLGLQAQAAFQSTRPLRGATPASILSGALLGISIHAPLAGRDLVRLAPHGLGDISIHAPLAGRDYTSTEKTHNIYISIHAPLAGRDSKSVQIALHIFAITDKF